MQSVSYLAALRRRWPLIVVLAIVGLVIGIVLAPSRNLPANASPLDVSHGGWTATASVGIPPATTSGTSTPSATRAALFYAGAQTVAKTTADAMNLHVPPSAIRGALTFVPSISGDSLIVTGAARTRQVAVRLVNTFLDEESSYLNGIAAAKQAAVVARDRQQVQTLRAQASKLLTQLQALRGQNTSQARLQAAEISQQRAALKSAYVTAYQGYATAKSTPAPSNFFVVLQPASASTAVLHRMSVLKRPAVLALLGLLLGGAIGVALALALAQIDRRLRSISQVELAFRAPVLVEIPRQPLQGTPDDVVVSRHPTSATAEAYRQLRTMLVFGADSKSPLTVERERVPEVYDVPRAIEGDAKPARKTSGSRKTAVATVQSRARGGLSRQVARRPHDGGHIVLISSAGAERSRSATTANLAAAFAELNLTVLLIITAANRQSNNSGPIQSTGPVDIKKAVQPTGIPQIATLDLSHLNVHLGSDRSVSDIVAEASLLADLIVIDAAPVMTAHDVGVLSALANDVIIVAEYGFTTVEAAGQAADLLTRMGVKVDGVVVTQVQQRRSWWPPRRREPLQSTPIRTGAQQ